MPKSKKDKYHRFEMLDRCISNTGRKWFFDNLLVEVNMKLNEEGYDGVSERSLRQDIEDMILEFDAPIVKQKDGRRIHYRYSDPNYSFSRRPLTEEEAHRLSEAIKVFGSFEGMPQFDWMQELTAKLESEFGLNQEPRPFIQFDANLDLEGMHHFTPLYNGISQKRVFRARYQPYPPGEAFECTFHPYFLKQYNNRWFVMGWNAEMDRHYLLALDRIAKLDELDKAYRPPGDFDFNDHFEQVVGVTVKEGEPAQRVVLRFFPPALHYVTTKPLHLSQKKPTLQEDGSALVEVHVIPNFELIQQILFYGDQVEVLEPASLRESVKERVGMMNKRYA